MGLYDLTMKVLFDDNPAEMAGLALGEGVRLEEVALEPTETVVLERRMDRLARVRAADEEFLLLPEFKAAYDADIDEQMFTYVSRAVILHEFMPVLPVVYYLTGDGYPRNPKRSFSWKVHGRLVGETRFEEVRLFEWTARRALESRIGMMLSIVPLLREVNPELVVEASKGIEGLEKPPEVKRNLQGVLVLLGKQAFPELDLENQIPKELYMHSTLYEQILEEGIEKGRAEGIEKGIEKGIKEAVLRSLEVRLKAPVSDEVRTGLDALTSDKLMELLTALNAARSKAAVRQAVTAALGVEPHRSPRTR